MVLNGCQCLHDTFSALVTLNKNCRELSTVAVDPEVIFPISECSNDTDAVIATNRSFVRHHRISWAFIALHHVRWRLYVSHMRYCVPWWTVVGIMTLTYILLTYYLHIAYILLTYYLHACLLLVDGVSWRYLWGPLYLAWKFLI